MGRKRRVEKERCGWNERQGDRETGAQRDEGTERWVDRETRAETGG